MYDSCGWLFWIRLALRSRHVSGSRLDFLGDRDAFEGVFDSVHIPSCHTEGGLGLEGDELRWIELHTRNF